MPSPNTDIMSMSGQQTERGGTCEDVGAKQPGPGPELDAGQQREGVKGQAVKNNELEDIWPNCENKIKVAMI